MITSVSPFLAFRGQAAEALALYARALGAEIAQVTRYAEGEDGEAGTIRHATLSIGSNRLTLIDVPDLENFTFTPAQSLLVDCDSAEAVARLASDLADPDNIMMPLGSYPFGDAFTWFADRFGVNWQIFLSATRPIRPDRRKPPEAGTHAFFRATDGARTAFRLVLCRQQRQGPRLALAARIGAANTACACSWLRAMICMDTVQER